MIHLSRDKYFAITIFLIVNIVVYFREDKFQLGISLTGLGAILIPILIPEVYGWLKGGVSPNHVSLFFWLIFIIVSISLLFNLSLY